MGRSIRLNQNLICVVGLCVVTLSQSVWADRRSDDLYNLTGLHQYTVSPNELEDKRAKQGVDVLQQMNQNDQNAWLEQNQLQSNITGDNFIFEDALNNIEGIATVIQNTGNQVIIQDSTLLNITVIPQ